LNVADAGSRRLRRVTFVGLVQPTPMQETEAFREGVKVLRIQVNGNDTMVAIAKVTSALLLIKLCTM
jgi:hypothetical protein